MSLETNSCIVGEFILKISGASFITQDITSEHREEIGREFYDNFARGLFSKTTMYVLLAACAVDESVFEVGGRGIFTRTLFETPGSVATELGGAAHNLPEDQEQPVVSSFQNGMIMVMFECSGVRVCVCVRIYILLELSVHCIIDSASI